jgi:hypothetical protein
MKTTARTVKAMLLGVLLITLFGFPIKNASPRFGENQSFYKRDYCRIYLENCRKRYRIIYNDGNRDLDGLASEGSR